VSVSDHDTHSKAAAIRALLASPLLLRSHDEELFRSVATQRGVLEPWFEENLGWQLHVDVRAGIARLHKRTRSPDPRRGLRRSGASKRPFDAFRYQLVALICAELLRRPHTTLGDLSDAIAHTCAMDEVLRPLDVGRQADRVAFVDALLWLIDVGAVDVTAGEIDGFSSSQDIDAVLIANTTIIPLLLSSDTAPSRIRAETSAQWVERLLDEPRYGTAATDVEGIDRDQRARWARHQAIRGLLDDPAVDLESLHPAVRTYLFSPAGRDKVLAAAADAGLSVERHADVWLAIDPTRESTPAPFTSTGRASTVDQAAAIVLSQLVDVDGDGRRRLLSRSTASLGRALHDQLKKSPGWAQTYRSGPGADALLSEAIDRLEEFGIAVREGDHVVPRPAAGRFAVRIVTGTAAKGKSLESLP
jgi:uncharacterized protein (TIGR02678 family)